MSRSEVENVKRALSFSGADSSRTGFTEEQLATAREASRGSCRHSAGARLLAPFYQNQPGSLASARSPSHGGTRPPAGLGAELERLIGVPSGSSIRSAASRSREVHEREQCRLTSRVAIGLGSRTRAMRAVNLLPRDEAKRSFAAIAASSSAASAALPSATVVLGSMMMTPRRAANSKQEELDGLRAQIAAIPTVPVIDTYRRTRSQPRRAPASARSPPRSPAASRGTACCARSRSCSPRTSG